MVLGSSTQTRKRRRPSITLHTFFVRQEVPTPCNARAQDTAAGSPAKWPLDERISFVLRNPKLADCNAFERYQSYKHARTVQDALDRGAQWGDLAYDFSKGYMSRTRGVSDPNAFKHVISLGSRCLAADMLRDLGLRRYSCPFDWIYSSPQMVAHCLEDKFEIFLDDQQIEKSGKSWGHRFYSQMLDRGVVYPHHDPAGKHRDDFHRRVERFTSIVSSSGRKLLFVCSVIESLKSVKRFRELDGKEFQDLFAALLKTGCSDFEVLAVSIICGPPSEAITNGKPSQPVVKELKDQGLSVGDSRLVVFDLHCVGACTGLRFKSKTDVDALSGLVMTGRTFDLACDPLPSSTSADSDCSAEIQKRLRPQGSDFCKARPTKTMKRLRGGYD